MMTGPQRVAGLIIFRQGDCNTRTAPQRYAAERQRTGSALKYLRSTASAPLSPPADQAHDATAGAEEGECCRQERAASIFAAHCKCGGDHPDVTNSNKYSTVGRHHCCCSIQTSRRVAKCRSLKVT